MSTVMQSSSKRLKAGTLLSYAYSFAQVVVNLLYVPLLLSSVGSEEYGLYQLIGSVMAYLSITNSMFQVGTTRFYCKYFAEGNTEKMEDVLAVSRTIYRVASGAICIIGFVAVFVIRAAYAHVLSDFQLTECAIMLAILVADFVIILNNSVYVSVINAHERFSFLKITQLLTVVLQPVFVIPLVAIWPYAMVIPCVQISLNIVCAVLQRLYAKKNLQAKVILHDKNSDLMKQLLVFSSGIVLALLADQLFWKTNQFILGYYFGMTVVAVYSIATQIQMIYLAIGVAIPSVFTPRVSILFHREKDMRAISDLFIKVGRISLYPLLLIYFGFVVFGSSFIDLWAGEEYQGAYLLTIIIMAPLTIDLAQNIGLTILQVTNKYAFRGKVYFLVAIVNIVLVLLVAPEYGAVGAALCSAISMFVGNGIIMNVYYSREIGLDILSFWKNAARVTTPLLIYACAAYALVILTNVSLDSWLSLITGIAAFATGYAAVAYLCSMDKQEKNLVSNAVSKRTLTASKRSQQTD